MPRSVETIELPHPSREIVVAAQVLRWGQRGSRPKAFVQLRGQPAGQLLKPLVSWLDQADDICSLPGEVVLMMCTDLKHGTAVRSIVADWLQGLKSESPGGLAARPLVLVESDIERRVLSMPLPNNVQTSGAASVERSLCTISDRLAVDADLVLDVDCVTPQAGLGSEIVKAPGMPSITSSDAGVAGRAARFWRGAAALTGLNVGSSRQFLVLTCTADDEGSVSDAMQALNQVIQLAGVARPDCSV